MHYFWQISGVPKLASAQPASAALPPSKKFGRSASLRAAAPDFFGSSFSSSGADLAGRKRHAWRQLVKP